MENGSFNIRPTLSKVTEQADRNNKCEKRKNYINHNTYILLK